MEKSVYVVVSQSRTLTARLLQKFTKSKYCHVSLSVEEDLSVMYSFGRRFANTPLFGGYIRESPNGGIFKRYPQIDVYILRFAVEEEKFQRIKDKLEEMYLHKKQYKYDYWGVWRAKFHKQAKSKKKSYCSKFVKDILEGFGVIEEGILPSVPYPADFIETFPDKIIYNGNFQSYYQQ